LTCPRSAAREASRLLAGASLDARNDALSRAAALLSGSSDGGAARAAVLEANASDVAAAAAAGLPTPLQKRLGLDSKTKGLIRGLRDLQAQPDPIGRELMRRRFAADGPVLRRVSCPIGVLLIVFESRPDAVVQIASLCLKAGNAVILKGGKEAAASNRALVDHVLAPAVAAAGLPAASVQLVEAREEVSGLLEQDKLIDLVIPRGSAALVRHVMRSTRIPVMGHSDGLCTVYLHDDAAGVGGAGAGPPGCAAARIVVDSKTQYMAACNSAETLLLSEEDLGRGAGGAAGVALASLLLAGVELRCDAASLGVARRCEAAVRGEAPDADAEAWAAAARGHVVSREAAEAGAAAGGGGAVAASDGDWDTEWLGPVMAVRAVRGVAAAAAHVNAHGSGHTDCIVTADAAGAGAAFQAAVGSASVFVNMSTRFADGFRYGFGAEVGVSTARLHARGPVGLEGLTTYKYLAEGAPGAGSFVAQFEGGGAAEAGGRAAEWAHADE